MRDINHHHFVKRRKCFTYDIRGDEENHQSRIIVVLTDIENVIGQIDSKDGTHI